MKFKPQKNFCVCLCAVCATVVVLNFWLEIKIFGRNLLYLSRPMWDTDRNPYFVEIPRIYLENSTPAELCAFHGWRVRKEKKNSKSKQSRIFDATIISVEIDLLEIRLHELWPVVDVFVVLEANRTFTGKSKPFFLRNQIERFAWAKEKLVIVSWEGLPDLPRGEGPFWAEGQTRNYMEELLVRHGLRDGDLLIATDVDEIPNKHAIELFKYCTNYPATVHLMMTTYKYSFEFIESRNNIWQAKIMTYKTNVTYYNSHHGLDGENMTSYILTDAGWHCTFCFRYLSDFVFKMTSYSHNDRVLHPEKQLDKAEIQKKICEGSDVFDMLPEVYSFGEMLTKLSGRMERVNSLTNLPRYLVEKRKRFAFLLPEGCQREDLIKR